jgi:hypothetical protein
MPQPPVTPTLVWFDERQAWVVNAQPEGARAWPTQHPTIAFIVLILLLVVFLL